MTISSSLNAGVAGLAANANRLATISDNIANSSTYGYKRSQTDFHSMVIGSNRGTYSAGGVRITSMRMIDQPGALEATSNPTDLAVRGRGFLPVTQETALMSGTDDYPMYLATTGSFRTDANGFLRTSTGLVLLGWPADPDGAIPAYPRDTSDGLEPVQIQTNQFAAEPTTEITLGVNLPATETEFGAAGTALPLSVEYFDNLGTSQSINVTYTPTLPGAPGASNTWTMTMRDSAQGGALIGEYTLVFDATQGLGGTLDTVTLTAAGTAAGAGVWDPASGVLTVDVGPLGDTMSINIGAQNSGSIMTQLSDSFAPTAINKNGFPVGNLTSVEVDGNGMVSAVFDTGITRTLYQIPIVDLPNPNGLIALDNQIYTLSSTSGSFFLWDAGDGPTGDVVGYALEGSATDIAGELTDLIQTQRAYSSNAKVIQTVDEMLQETTNIKR
ncbi:flagellar hook protein FlgE [Rhodovulum euryhalinum]|uniref:Flagellar hook protein FlgE n=1 Tax=Rhodovulum euryhalinum TaxID=35805 RepID=A0A4R2KJE6_9RHOB|nr:flagellar hook protein FlgE [Rhodovulum euryhalinum]TCO73384.1 flagellar hook protein FlgE [Rhodovulum euryhalinum]